MISTKRQLYQIFYPVKKFDDPEQAFSDYFCTPEYVKNFADSTVCPDIIEPRVETIEENNKNIVENIQIEPVINTPTPTHTSTTTQTQTLKHRNQWFEPMAQDTMFWCLFYHVHGVNEYGEIAKNFGKRELDEKQKIVEYYTGKDGKKNAAGLKNGNQKLTNADIQETLSGLMVNKKTTILELFAMASYYKVGVVLRDSRNHTCIELIPEGVQTIYNIDYNTDSTVAGKWRTRIENDEPDDDNNQNKYYKLEQWNKPLKGVSSYKLGELQEIANKLGVDMNLKKQELYEKLAQTIVWKN